MRYQYCYVATNKLTGKQLAISVLANNKKDANKIVFKIKEISKFNDISFFERVVLNKEQQERFKDTTIEEQLNLINDEFPIIKILKCYKIDNITYQLNINEWKHNKDIVIDEKEN